MTKRSRTRRAAAADRPSATSAGAAPVAPSALPKFHATSIQSDTRPKTISPHSAAPTVGRVLRAAFCPPRPYESGQQNGGGGRKKWPESNKNGRRSRSVTEVFWALPMPGRRQSGRSFPYRVLLPVLLNHHFVGSAAFRPSPLVELLPPRDDVAAIHCIHFTFIITSLKTFWIVEGLVIRSLTDQRTAIF